MHKNNSKPAITGIGHRMLLAFAISTAVDLSLSTANGYNFRTDTALLISLNAFIIALLIAATFGVLYLMHSVAFVRATLEQKPWFSCLSVAWAPICLALLWRYHSPAALGMQAGVLVLLLAVRYFEGQRASRLSPKITSLTLVAATLLMSWLATRTTIPGRAMLRRELREGASPATVQSPNLLMIVLDTMRSDHLEVYGYPRPTSPWLKQFGGQATIFDYAFASSSYTLPSHATLFTGLFSRSHGADIVDGEGGVTLLELKRLGDQARVGPLDSEAVTLAEIAHEAGLETGAICANSAYLYRYFGLDQGFETYVDARPVDEYWRPAGLSIGYWLLAGHVWSYRRLVDSNDRYYLLASEVNTLAQEWLESRRSRRFFLFLNYMEPHWPYLPTGEYKHLFPQADTVSIDAYDAETRCLDDHLAALFARLEAWNVLNRTLVVIVGDHGESFGEHNKWGHTLTLYEPEVRVPLLVRLPGQQKGNRVDRFVHLVDVMPTILDAMGFARPQSLEGSSLFGVDRPYPLVSYLGKYQRNFEESAIYHDPWKLIQRSNGDVELYDIRRDAAERKNVAPQNPEVVETMLGNLEHFHEEIRPRFDSAQTNKLDTESQRRLKSLGYIK
jgi:arylsulfatase A-like enzyme